MRSIPLTFITTAALVMCACGGTPPPPDPRKLPVAKLDSRTLTVSDLEDYLRNNLAEAAGDEAATTEEIDRVKSRLFDNFIDERLLLIEAERRRITVSPEEIAAYLGSGDDAPQPVPGWTDAEQREVVRRDLLVQKLRESLAVGEAKVDPAEVEAYVAEHQNALQPPAVVVIRTLTLDSAERAEAVREQLNRKRVTFREAVKTLSKSPLDAQLQETSLDNLPEAVQAALASLKPGQVSAPVEDQGRFVLYCLQSGPRARKATLAELREKAQEILSQRKVEEALDRVVDELRRKAKVEFFTANLPFRYVPETRS
jgi:hypothetical protein